ncbi:Hint domain-containing protein [Rhodobacter sp. NSM]|uniref:Hint domain-containing protein n=1 Tax=Rhodobacter sp. NSM TaxID=3457501 RepID=UPI003FCFEC18
MATYTFYGYHPNDWITETDATGKTGIALTPDWTQADRLTFTITDDDGTLSGGGLLGGASDWFQQTGSVTSSSGTSTSTFFVKAVTTLVGPDGAATYVYEIANSSGLTVGYAASMPIVPGVGYTMGSTTTTSGVSYSTLQGGTNTWDAAAANSVTGGAYGDQIYTGAGADSINSGAGHDYISSGSEADVIDAGSGNDTIYFGTGDDTIYGGDGNDTIDDVAGQQWSGVNYIDAGAGDDLVYAGNDDDTVQAGEGNDRVYAEEGNDLVYGGVGNDRLDGGNGNDTLAGDGGSDSIYGGGGADVIHGGSGSGISDAGGDGNDYIDGGDGNDTIQGGTDNDTMLGGSGSDQFSIRAGDGVDTIFAGEDADGGDRDTLDFSQTTGGVNVGFGGWETGSYTVAGGGSGSFREIEQVVGGSGADTISGGMAAETLAGGGGEDRLSGGVDDLESRDASGHDVLTGGTGRDTFVIGAGYGRDIVTDFNMTTLDGGTTTDRIDVSNLLNDKDEPITAWDVTISDDGNGNAVLTFPSGDQLVLEGVSPSQIDNASALHSMGIPCLLAGTRIATPAGLRPIEDLKIGDLVETSRGVQPLLWVGSRTVTLAEQQADPRMLPVAIPAGCFGEHGALRMSRQHCIALTTSEGPALVRAAHLAARKGPASSPEAEGDVSYHHLLLPAHDLVLAEGLPVETLWPGPVALSTFGRKVQFDLVRGLPRLAAAVWGQRPVEEVYGPAILPVLTGAELRERQAGWSRPLHACMLGRLGDKGDLMTAV